ncbi:phospholipid/cholesterol/gamma-HCH transport system substrate-binding protein [Nocardia amikacinitolerans]|uniref:Phospholipid/cholesterol/gamma-HCH transport system substrate-binding protein n=1 Tax=Nocardia amikacinitolerans TaxID=756689 RepID=A0A285LX77_9NOCA|nr:MCE family protein [Nocardia amikacinitolerans]MCP2279822.1 phospholipid/cholesterol/gamma-HCH transport system substrate-binding protein [Nocardia amikacinitolerans]MCP2300255.1 phospholipid/cholesterol/gamma-HCH transport system substrate-binding protein [Nocardia amikacinitolerans]MCP2317267.1 phospholipid/cholesterol/gamma-HCH transport system substrate-binding protein [Nocardia amikacinitolerans]SNY89073.1 phospholipid/cholesterol/gamma-HCH transport system substrate-binding protein [No
MRNTATTVKLTIFALVMALVFTGLVIVFSQVRFAREYGYHAVFTSSSGMLPGAKVRIAGVPVGSVTSVKVGKDNLAHVEFDVDRKYQLLTSTRATIKYENLVGDRYMELLDGPGSADKLREGGTIGTDKTAPALDLDMLLGGFKPLLRGLDPGQVNDLTNALLQIFQGQGGTLVSLLNSGGSFAKTLGERDALIGSVIDNLNAVLATIDERGEQFDTTLTELQRLVSGLAADRDPIGDALPRIAGATGDLTDLLAQARPDLRGTIEQTGRLATNLDNGSDTVQWVLERLPETYRKLIRIGSYGSFLALYVCSTNFIIDGPNGQPLHINMPGGQDTGRCAPE